MFDYRSRWKPVPENTQLITHSTALLDQDQGTRSWRWTCPCCADKHLHLAMRPTFLTGSMLCLAILGQIRDQYLEGDGYYVDKGQKFACLLQLAKSGFNPWKHTKTLFLERKVCCIFPDRCFPQWQVSHLKLYPQLCLWDFTEGFAWVSEGREILPYTETQNPLKHMRLWWFPSPAATKFICRLQPGKGAAAHLHPVCGNSFPR